MTYPRIEQLDIRLAIVLAVQKLKEQGFNGSNEAGNVSVRDPENEGFWISASAVDPKAMGIEHVVPVRWDGIWSVSRPKPSSEWQMHLKVYQARPDVIAIVHCHSRFCKALACNHRGIDPVHYHSWVARPHANRMVIPCVTPFELPGEENLAKQVAAKASEGYLAMLIANHGNILFGEASKATLSPKRELQALEGAVKLAGIVEELAENFLLSLIPGNPQLIPEDKWRGLDKVFEKYGK